MTKYRNSNAPASTATYNRTTIETPTENIYEALSIIAKRSNQINLDIRKELHEKLDEFALTTTVLKRFSKTKSKSKFLNFTSVCPSPMQLLIEEWLNDNIYHRNTEDNNV